MRSVILPSLLPDAALRRRVQDLRPLPGFSSTRVSLSSIRILLSIAIGTTLSSTQSALFRGVLGTGKGGAGGTIRLVATIFADLSGGAINVSGTLGAGVPDGSSSARVSNKPSRWQQIPLS